MLRGEQRLCRRQWQRRWSSSSKLMDVPSESVYGLKITTKHHSYKASPITQTFRMQWPAPQLPHRFWLLFALSDSFKLFLHWLPGRMKLLFFYCHYAEYSKLLRTTLDQCDKIQRNETKQPQQNIFQNNTQIKTMSLLIVLWNNLLH